MLRVPSSRLSSAASTAAARTTAILLGLCLLAGGAIFSGVAGAASPRHSLVEVDLQDAASREYLMARLGQFDVVFQKPGYFAHVAADQATLDLLRGSPLRWKVLIDDLQTHYAYPDKTTNFGIYHTYSESAAFVDSLRLLYPQVISQKWSLGQSHEGRNIWCFRVSDNPDLDEDEPEILIDGMHHAREIMASEFGIMFAEYLASNYGTDPEVTWLLDNRELYLVPIVNPDGVVYNEATDPAGGGMWRKNRRPISVSTYGVDLNRNYPYQWGYDDSGSSPTPSSDLYRGPFAGSEPEVQAMMALINGHAFATHNTVHTYSNLTLYPWGYETVPTPDDAVFDHMAAQMVSLNGYTPGQPGEVLYEVNGGAFDWAYGAQTEHAKIFSFSNEIGGAGDGFWPLEERRGALFQENLWPNLYLMRVAGPFIAVHSPVVTPAVPAKTIEPGQDGELNLTVENQSVTSSSLGGTVTVATDDPWVQFTAAVRPFGALASMQATDLAADPLPFSVEPGCPDGHRVFFSATVPMDAGVLEFPLDFMVGQPATALTDDLESGTGNFILGGSWGTTTTRANSPTTSLTDSPGGAYADNVTAAAQLAGTYRAAALGYWTGYSLESGWDYGYVQVSADGGPWLTLRTYTGVQSTWTYQEIDLGAYTGQDLAFRFLLVTDTYVTDDGWYIDDVTVFGDPDANQPPASPVAVSPLAGATVADPVTLTVANSADPDTDPVTYGFRIYADAACTQVVADAAAVTEGEGQTAWTAPSLPDGQYWWRAYAGDALDRSSLSAPLGFAVSGASGTDALLAGGPLLRILGPGIDGGSARVQLTLPAAGSVTLDVFDARGARVRRLHAGPLGAGVQIMSWDGRDDRGAAAASGVYFVRAVAAARTLTAKAILVR